MKTKTSGLIILLFLLSSLSLHSQEIKFGALAGIGITNAHVTNKPEIAAKSLVYNPMLSYSFNLYVGYKSEGVFGCSAEPGYIQKGGTLTYNEESKDDNVNMKLMYLQFPLLADFFITDKLFVSIGPEFAYLINAKAKSKDHSMDIMEFYDNQFELSGMIGINYNIFKRFDIGLRYSHGITHTKQITWTNEEGIVKGNSEEYNQYWLFIFRYKI